MSEIQAAKKIWECGRRAWNAGLNGRATTSHGSVGKRTTVPCPSRSWNGRFEALRRASQHFLGQLQGSWKVAWLTPRPKSPAGPAEFGDPTPEKVLPCPRVSQNSPMESFPLGVKDATGFRRREIGPGTMLCPVAWHRGVLQAVRDQPASKLAAQCIHTAVGKQQPFMPDVNLHEMFSPSPFSSGREFGGGRQAPLAQVPVHSFFEAAAHDIGAQGLAELFLPPRLKRLVPRRFGQPHRGDGVAV